MTDKFTFFESYYEAAKMLPEEERGPFLMAVCSYAFDGAEPDLSGAQALAFVLIRPNIDSSMKRSEAGRRGGKKQPSMQKASKQPERQHDRQPHGSLASDAEGTLASDGSSVPVSDAVSMLASTLTSTLASDGSSMPVSTLASDKDMDMDRDEDMEGDRSFSLEKNSYPHLTSGEGSASAVAEPSPKLSPHCPLCGSELPRQDGTAMWYECPTCGAIKEGAVVWR